MEVCINKDTNYNPSCASFHVFEYITKFIYNNLDSVLKRTWS